MKQIKQNKMITFLVLAALIVLGSVSTAKAVKSSHRNMKFWFNDMYVMSNEKIFTQNGYTYVPLGFLSEELGYDVKFDAQEKSARLTKDNENVTISIDSNVVDKNGAKFTLASNVIQKDSKIYVPLGYFSDVENISIRYSNDYKLMILGDGYDKDNAYQISFYDEKNKITKTDAKLDIKNIAVIENKETKKFNSEEEILNYIDNMR